MSKRRTLGIVTAGALAVGVMGWAGGAFTPSVTQAAAAALAGPAQNWAQTIQNVRYGMGQGWDMSPWQHGGMRGNSWRGDDGAGYGMHMGRWDGELGLDANLAEALGITEEDLEAARTAAHEAALELAVAEGRLTEEQAAQLAESGIGRMGGLGLRGVGLDDEQLAAALDISVDELNAARAAAWAARLEQAVADGELTQEQVDSMLAHQAFGDYQREAQRAQLEAEIAAVVEAGALTQEQANLILDDLTTFGRGHGGWGSLMPGMGGHSFGGRGHMGGQMGGHMRGRGHMDGFGPHSMMPGMRGQGRGWGFPNISPDSAPESTPEALEESEEESEDTESQSTTPDSSPLVNF